ncbi:MAG: hypothetical protein K2Y37_21500 [Pirellulales bacterium]|nr:hypothetical protein [Pirellulales bacterium]
MVGNKSSKRIAELFRNAEWAKARAILNKELAKHPENHWLITQLGVTYYEEREYGEALKQFRKSYQIVSDCPLTLWNLAGTFAATSNYAQAAAIYIRLITESVAPAADPCWESGAWSASLKADCYYRLGICFSQLEKRQEATSCFEQYLSLISAGIDGSYTAEQAAQRLRKLSPSSAKVRALKLAANKILAVPGIKRQHGNQFDIVWSTVNDKKTRTKSKMTSPN